MPKDEMTNSRRGRGSFWIAAPLALCLPCLLVFVAGAVLTGVGVAAVGSFFSDNAFLLAVVIVLAMLVALVIGLGISRLRGRGRAIRFASRDAERD